MRKLIVSISVFSLLFICVSCGSVDSTEKSNRKISLAQWSLHKDLFDKKITTLDFPVIAKQKYGIDAVEYVSQFFADKAEDEAYLKQLKLICAENGVKSLLIMIDGEGSLADGNDSIRKIAIQNHYKWVKAARFLGCHSIRVNLHGSNDSLVWKNASVDALSKLSAYAQNQGINVVVENHGGFSSNGGMVAEVIKAVNRPNCGTLPDFGNFCMRREKGDLWESPCVEYYDKYKGVGEMLPFAKGVSAKSLDFDDDGNETTIDYKRMFQLVDASGYSGYIGIEYEGNTMSEDEGIKATKKLLEAF